MDDFISGLDRIEAAARMHQMANTQDLRNIRRQCGLSLAEIARVIGVSPSTIHHWESGARAPKGDNALRYLAVLERLAPLAA